METADGDSRPLIVGEVLFDCFPDGCAILGGAPFNVAWHLQGFGFSPIFISAVGRDDRAETVISAMKSWGMDTGGIQRDDYHPTGTVAVHIDEAGSHRFEICADQAYDYIDADRALAAARGASPCLLYHGTLALRRPASARTLLAMRERLSLPVFVDLNLRTPWWSTDLVEQVITGVDWLKLNDEELEIVSGLQTFDRSMLDACIAAAQSVRKRYSIGSIIVTRGDKGGFLVTSGGNSAEAVITAAPVHPQHFVDSIGAGDSFSAVAIASLLTGKPHRQLLDAATAFAARICGIKGATAADTDLYQSPFGN